MTETAKSVKSSRAAEVHTWIRNEILMDRVKPGTWLRQEEIASKLSVSRMPVREALHFLTEEGLVEFLPNRGARVTELSVEELEELYAARMGLEGLAARHAAVRITGEDLDDLRLRLPRLTTLCAAGELDEYLREDREFVIRCLSSAQRPRLVSQIVNLRERSERYLRLVFRSAERFEHLEWVEYSYRLFQACVAKNPVDAEIAMQGALQWTLQQAIPLLESHITNNASSTTLIDNFEGEPSQSGRNYA